MVAFAAYYCAVIYADEKITAAKSMYLRRLTAQEIAHELNIGSVRTVYNWIDKNGWRDLLEHETPMQAIERRIVVLTGKTSKDAGDLRELDTLVTNFSRLKKIYARAESHSENSDGKSGKRKKGKQTKNDISELTAEDFEREFGGKMFAYQRKWRDVKNDAALCWTRFILKSRQIGATYYFAAEAFEDAVLNGDNQIFISASKAQAELFRAYIIGFARDWFQIELSGNPIIFSNGAELHFLSTNKNTAQGYHGHVYYDEVFWTQSWAKLQNVSSGMAMQAKYRQTYFSTPSTKNHAAFAMWNGDKFNDTRKKKAVFDLDNKTLAAGVMGADGIWRQRVTVDDALRGGCNLFDLERLKLRYSKDEYNNLLMCEFIDDTHSVFSLNDIEAGMTDCADWKDFSQSAARPFGNNPVWIGYDPSRTTDSAAVVVLAPPAKQGGKFRLLETFRYVNVSFQFQANRIQDLLARYNVEHVAMDTTGMGYGAYELVQGFFPTVTPIHYSLDSKAQLVLKALNVFSEKRFLFDAAATEVAQAFMTIRRITTPSGQVSYNADRSEKHGHADLAFAIMHALAREPINTQQRASTWAL
jgi:uncharacterized protein YjcR